ncbi:mucin-2-like isoform X2 [Engraulis encrasicolus]|uniref:mucin-2-like isoform X2 n=1 Tax=Engraulis encrasicolus TaxID=184585 RepID=UPI002FCF1FBC
MSGSTEENMKADTFSTLPRSAKQPPPVPPKSPSQRGVRRTMNDPSDITKSSAVGTHLDTKSTAVGIYQQTAIDTPKSTLLEVYQTPSHQENISSLGVPQTQKDQDMPNRVSSEVYQTPSHQEQSNSESLGVCQTPKRPPPVPPKSPSLKGVRQTQNSQDNINSQSLGVYQTPNDPNLLNRQTLGVNPKTPKNEDAPKSASFGVYEYAPKSASSGVNETPIDPPENSESIFQGMYQNLNQDNSSTTSTEVYKTQNKPDTPSRQTVGVYQVPSCQGNSIEPSLGVHLTPTCPPPVPPKSPSIKVARRTQNSQGNTNSGAGVYQTPKDADIPKSQSVRLYQSPKDVDLSNSQSLRVCEPQYDNESPRYLDITSNLPSGVSEMATDLPENPDSPSVGEHQTLRDPLVPPKSPSLRPVHQTQNNTDTTKDTHLIVYQTPKQGSSNNEPLGIYQTPGDPVVTSSLSLGGCTTTNDPAGANRAQGNQDDASDPSLGQYQTPKDCDVISSPPDDQEGPSAMDSSASPVPARPPPVPRKTKSYIYLRPNISAKGDGSYGRQASSPSLASSPSSSQPPPPTPKSRNIYLSSRDILAGCSTTPRDLSPRSSTTPRDLSPRSSTTPRDLSPRSSTTPRDLSPRSSTTPRDLSPRSSTTPRDLSPRSSTTPRDLSPRSSTTPRDLSPRSSTTPRDLSPRSSTTPRDLSPRSSTTPRDLSPQCSSTDSQKPEKQPYCTFTESTPLVQMPGTQGVAPKQTCPSEPEPAEYDTLLPDDQKAASAATPPPVPPKSKSRPRPQSVTSPTGGCYNKLPHSKSLPRFPASASSSASTYQAPTAGSSGSSHLHTAKWEVESPGTGTSEPEAYADRDVRPMRPRATPRGSHKHTVPTPAPRPQGPALSAPHQSAIYEPMVQEMTSPTTQPPATRGGSTSSNPPHPQPPSFSPPPPPSPSPRVAPRSPSSGVYQELIETPLPDGSSGAYLEPIGTLSPCGSAVYQEPTGTPYYSTEILPHHNTETLPRRPFANDDEGTSWLRKTMDTMKLFSHDSSRYVMTAEDKIQQMNRMAKETRMALKCFQAMLQTRGDALRSHISDLQGIAQELERVCQRHKLAGITGGTASAAGTVAAVVGIALAPLTMGASLIATGVGVGVAVAAGGVGAGSAINKKKKKSSDVKRVEEIIKTYREQVGDLDQCLEMVRTGMERLRRCQPVAGVNGASDEAVWMAQVAEAAYRLGKEGSATPSSSSSSPKSARDVLKDFDDGAGEEVYSNTKEGKKLRKGSEKKFGERVCTLAQQLQEALNDMTHAHETFTLATASV